MTTGGRMRPPGSGFGSGSGSGSGRGSRRRTPDLRDIFWQVVNRTLSASGATLSDDGVEVMEQFIGRGISTIQSSPFTPANLGVAERNLAEFVGEMIQAADSLGLPSVTSEAFRAALMAARRRKRWRFWPFS